jgi:DNA-binding XRE family transcriptional regulator
MMDYLTPEAVGRRLKLVRIAVSGDMSQAAYAELLGVGSTTYNNWERGRTRLPIESASKIKILFGYDSDYLYYGDTSGLPIQKIGALNDAENEARKSARSIKQSTGYPIVAGR